ncbi:MAG: anti-sigma factor family protein [Kineosporiaceae bacterium]
MSLLKRRISCQELVELASDYLDGRLAPTTAGTVERHLAECPNCPSYLEQLRLTVRLTGALRQCDVPDELLDVLRRAWDDEHGGAT